MMVPSTALRRQIASLTRRIAVGTQDLQLQTVCATARWSSSVTSADRGMSDSHGAPETEPNEAKAQKEVSDSTEQQVPKEKYGICITKTLEFDACTWIRGALEPCASRIYPRAQMSLGNEAEPKAVMMSQNLLTPEFHIKRIN